MDFLQTASSSWGISATRALLILALIPLYFTTRTIYRLYFHPLSSFKGPREAAISTRWIRNVHRSDRPHEIFDTLHKEYDTKILRIGPNELHITDLSAYEKIYGRKPEFAKEDSWYGSFGNGGSAIFVERDLRVHQYIRKMMNPLFSQGSINKLEPHIREHINGIFDKVVRMTKQGQEIDLYYMFRSFTIDAISHFAFGETLDFKNTSQDSFHHDFFDVMDGQGHEFPNIIYNWPRRIISRHTPKFVLRRLAAFKHVEEFNDLCVKATDAYTESEKKTDYPVVFDRLTWMKPNDRHLQAQEVLGAGTDTTSLSLSIGVTNILKHPQVKDKLIKELKENINETSTLKEIMNIEYLTAVVKEILRVALVVPGRLPRVVPKEGLVADDQFIPLGTIVGVSAWTMHNDPTVWGDDAGSFRPERWIGSDKKHLEKYFVPFSKGPRACIGLNLALTEMHFMLAMLFLRFDLTLTDDNLDYVDRFIKVFKGTGPKAKLAEIRA